MDLAPLLLPVAVALGATAQRVTGVGFALVASPLLVLVAGAFEGVLLANLLGLVVTVVVFLSSWRHVEWRKGILLAAAALCAIPLGAWVARTLDGPWLEVVVGFVIVVALVAVRSRPHLSPFRGRPGAVAAGATSGFMNVTAGVGGPAMVLYALGTRWEQRRFAATFQFYSIFVNVASIVAKGGPRVEGGTLGLALVGLAAGLILGHVVSGRVSAEGAQRWVFRLAIAGALATCVKGLVMLAHG